MSTSEPMWRSLEELSGAAAPPRDPSFEPPSRREALKLLGASLALAGSSACTRQPKETIVPYARSPEATIPGRPLYYATSMPWASGAIGLLVESHMGRPTKVEGNPDHPASLGSTDAFAQASVLALYDPDRTQVIQRRGRIATWDAFLSELAQALAAQEASQGSGLRLLTRTVTSPTLARQIGELQERFPAARWHQWEPVNRDNARAGAIAAFGTDVQPQHRFDRADVVLALDADFLGSGPESVRSARDFTSRRRGGRDDMSRLYVVETEPTLTGAMADHRKALRPSAVGAFATELHDALSREGESASAWVRALARDLLAHRGASLVVAGRAQPPPVHRLAHAMNALLGNAGRTVVYTRPVELSPVDQKESLRQLVTDMAAGSVGVLAILGGNPAYDAPANLDFAGALAKVGLRIHLGHSADETSGLCDWHVPEAHFLESWSDARAADGTVGIVQPLIAPLYFGRSAHELVAALAGKASVSAHDVVRETWKQGRPDAEFERWWRQALHDGLIRGTSFVPVETSLAAEDPPDLVAEPARLIEVAFRPGPTVWDGRFANDGWLQELPRPITKLTWDDAVLVAPATAAELGVESRDTVELVLDGRSVRAPVWVTPGHAERALTLHLGGGRTACGELGRGVGFDAYRLRSMRGMDSAAGVEVRKTGERWELASTQEHDRMEGRDLVRAAAVEDFRADPALFERRGEHGAGERSADEHGAPPAPEAGGHPTSLFPPHAYEGHAWGMVIDLNACTGCSACVVACQSENNIPIVGKDQVARGREMHWIRIDRYFDGPPSAPRIHHQPVPCMHCENAPCELVCPVNATVHSPEGLNEMVYNRCVGTRYCSNNCPYKVRRFNFYLYSDYETESLKPLRNPDVTVRSRGVMEKCTYCVQRINAAKIEAKKEDRPVRDGEIQTACQAVCPAQAITFGDVNDPESAVARLKKSPLEYGLLAGLDTRPRTTYLAKLRNPNPEIEDEA